MTVYLVVLLSVLNSIAQRGSKVVVSLYALDLGAGAAAVGVLAALFAVFPLLLAVQAGRISDRYGVRLPIALGGFAMAIGLLLPLVAGGLPALFLCPALLGLGHIYFHVSVHNLVGSLGTDAERTKNFSTFALGGSIAAFIGPSAAGFAIELAGFVVRIVMHRLAQRFTEVGVLTGSLFLAALAYLAVPGLADAALLAGAAFALGLALGSAQPLTIILTYNYAPAGRSGEALGMRIMANKVTQIAVPLAFGGMGAAMGATPVFLATGAFLLAAGILSLRA